MITIAVVALVGLAIAIRSALDDGWPDRIWAGAFGGLFGGLFGALAAIVVGGVTDHWQPNATRHPIPLVRVRSADGLSGSFVFGSGSIGTVEQYRCRYRGADGGIRALTVPAGSSTIFEEERLDGELIVVRSALAGAVRWFGLLFPEEWYEFHVPVGTVAVGLEM